MPETTSFMVALKSLVPLSLRQVSSTEDAVSEDISEIFL